MTAQSLETSPGRSRLGKGLGIRVGRTLSRSDHGISREPRTSVRADTSPRLVWRGLACLGEGFYSSAAMYGRWRGLRAIAAWNPSSESDDLEE